MTEVFVERRWDQALTDAHMQALFASAAGCMEVHRCEWHGSLLSADGHELFCHFSAPDAESVRIALREAGSPRGSVWAGTVHDAPGFTEDALGRANVLVSRRFAQPVALADIQAIEDAGAGCLETHRVRFVRTYFSTDRRRMICLYQAPDAESVRIAQREAGMPVERVVAFRQFQP
jgi:hypothetical protein